MNIEIAFDGSTNATLIAEAVLGSLEAFFATAIEQKIAPHTERFRISLVESSEAAKPSFEVNTLDVAGMLTWPSTLRPYAFSDQDTVQRALAEVCGSVLAATCLMADYEDLFERLFRDEAVQQRLAFIPASLNSYHRVMNRHLTRLDHWNDLAPKTYELRLPLPKLDRVKFPRDEEGQSQKAGKKSGEPPSTRDHRDMGVFSVIDIHAWNQATWRGAGYLSLGDGVPPTLGLMFEDEQAARKIFERWRERFGGSDDANAISISIVRHLPEQGEHDYCMIIFAGRPEKESTTNGARIFSMPNRSQMMQPADSTNLDRFLRERNLASEFYLVPAILKSEGSPPTFLYDLAIRKFGLRVLDASEVQEGEIESVAFWKRSPRRSAGPENREAM